MSFVAISSHFISKGEPEELIKHGLRALRETLPNEQELTTKVCWHLLTFNHCHFGSGFLF